MANRMFWDEVPTSDWIASISKHFSRAAVDEIEDSNTRKEAAPEADAGKFYINRFRIQFQTRDLVNTSKNDGRWQTAKNDYFQPPDAPNAGAIEELLNTTIADIEEEFIPIQGYLRISLIRVPSGISGSPELSSRSCTIKASDSDLDVDEIDQVTTATVMWSGMLQDHAKQAAEALSQSLGLLEGGTLTIAALQEVIRDQSKTISNMTASNAFLSDELKKKATAAESFDPDDTDLDKITKLGTNILKVFQAGTANDRAHAKRLEAKKSADSDTKLLENKEPNETEGISQNGDELSIDLDQLPVDSAIAIVRAIILKHKERSVNLLKELVAAGEFEEHGIPAMAAEMLGDDSIL